MIDNLQVQTRIFGNHCVKIIQMFSRTFLRLKSTSVTKDISEDVAKTLSRIRVIENVKECVNVTEKINAQESPIGVDAEAITGNFFQQQLFLTDEMSLS